MGQDPKRGVKGLFPVGRSIREVGVKRFPDDLRQGLAIAPHQKVDTSPLLGREIDLRSQSNHIQHSIQQR